VAPTVPALVPAKALRSDASIPTRRRSLRAPRVAGSVVATTEPLRGTDVAAGSRREATAAAAATAMATTMPTDPQAPAPVGGDRAAVVENPDDDAPPPGWGQWENYPATALDPAAGC
jgi:hypothetical protein